MPKEIVPQVVLGWGRALHAYEQAGVLRKIPSTSGMSPDIILCLSRRLATWCSWTLDQPGNSVLVILLPLQGPGSYREERPGLALDADGG